MSTFFGLTITTSIQHFHVNLVPTWRLSVTGTGYFFWPVTFFLQCTCSALTCVWKSILACACAFCVCRRYTRVKFYKRTCIKVVNLFSLKEISSMYINLFQTFSVFNRYVSLVASLNIWNNKHFISFSVKHI